MKKVMIKLLNKKEVKMVKGLKNNKGFSLIELLIVIAIMGVLAAIAFNMFGGILGDSKKKADKQQAANIQKALLLYMMESDDWELKGKINNTDNITKTNDGIIQALLQEITVEVNGVNETFGPMLSLKYPEKTAADTENYKAYAPQSPDYEGWKIVSYASKQAVSVEPEADSAKCTFEAK